MILTERHAREIEGVLCCYDRVVVSGTAEGWSYAGGMTSFFYGQNWKIFDFEKIFKPITEAIKGNAEKLCAENGIRIDYVRSPKAFRKEDRIEEILEERGRHEGLVWVFSQQELCPTFHAWHDKEKHKTEFVYHQTKCLHYYFYFIDREFGLCFMKVPTVAPYKCEFYFNGHSLLETKLRRRDVPYAMYANSFCRLADFPQAQALSDNFRTEHLRGALNAARKRFCPLPFDLEFSWTVHQVEYAMDINFKSREVLIPIYENIVKTAMHTVTPGNVSTFLGKRFSPLFEGEAGSNYNKRPLGTRVKHRMGATSLKCYDKANILRIECTSNNISDFRTFRPVQKRDGTTESRVAPLPKNISSLFSLAKIMRGACQRYLEFLSSFDDHSDGMRKLDKATEPVVDNNRNYRGFNPFDKSDKEILLTVADGDFAVQGVTNKRVRNRLPHKTSAQISRVFKRLRLHGIIKKSAASYIYHLTEFGRQFIAGVFSCINLAIAPSLTLA